MNKYHLSIKKLYKLISLILLTTLFYAIIFATIRSQWTILFVAGLTFLLTLLPWIAKKTYKIKTPTEIELLITLFIYATLFLGEIHDFYNIFWWWDLLLHAGSAIIFGFIGFIVIYYLASRQGIKARSWTLAIFSFSFAIAIGAIWEIFEFTMDQVFGFNMQKSGLIDTMGDLIIDTIGAVISSSIAYIYLKTKKTLIFNGIIKDIQKENPTLFSK
ncbi:hypothetical protein HN832_01020 [archaeon]|jgi:hypothetical protein|nr:hypothetical protein [archaeon]MBT4373793.1 hypothetical protein [archaeon]MBT4532259.1 hypothetical protein [archaeon]MBT7001084.1 hypothetical protein [archaeon]MBT7281973.1 hypothetical protein [archaeon]